MKLLFVSILSLLLSLAALADPKESDILSAHSVDASTETITSAPQKIDLSATKEKVEAILKEIDGLEDEELKPLAQELLTFLFKYDFLVATRKEGRARQDIEQQQKRFATDQINLEILALYKDTDRSIKKLLKKKQFKAYSKLIAEVAPRPNPPKSGSSANSISDLNGSSYDPINSRTLRSASGRSLNRNPEF